MFNEVRHHTRLVKNGNVLFILFYLFAKDELSDASTDGDCSLEGRHKFAQRMQLYKYMVRLTFNK